MPPKNSQKKVFAKERGERASEGIKVKYALEKEASVKQRAACPLSQPVKQGIAGQSHAARK